MFNLVIVAPGEGGVRTDVVLDFHKSGSEVPAVPPPVFPLPRDCWDGDDHIIYRTETGTATGSFRINIKTGKGAPVVIPKLENGQKSDDNRLVARRQLLRRMLPPGNVFLKDRLLAQGKVIHWKSDDGIEIEGILTLPAGPGKPPYPLVVHPHGGPHSRSAVGFDFTVQILAAKGYAVLQPNYRGSAGYGQKFIDADRNDFGGGDMRDILAGVADLGGKKIIDPSRQFVYGTSYGGFMTCWLVGHTRQFRAAAAQNAVTDLTAMWGLSDIQSWTEWEFGGRPWEAADAMRKHSPLNYVDKVKTPTLILHSRDDRRCPLPMGRMFYQSLKARNVPTRMVIYPGEGHGIRQPRHREDVLRRVLAWFKEHDKN